VIRQDVDRRVSTSAASSMAARRSNVQSSLTTYSTQDPSLGSQENRRTAQLQA